MKFTSSAIVTLLAAATASPVHHNGRQVETWAVTEFSASKQHQSPMCRFSFNVSAPSATNSPVECSALVDSGFTGATWLATVREGTCSADNWSWYFVDPQDSEATFAFLNVTVDGKVGMYKMPKEHIIVDLNDEPNPFDNDVYYGGPKDFDITEFATAD